MNRDFSKSTSKHSRSSGVVPIDVGAHCGVDYKGSGGKFGGDFFLREFGVLEGSRGGAHRQDSETVGESFWDDQALRLTQDGF